MTDVVARARERLAAYRLAMEQDATMGEATNGGNEAGDVLADETVPELIAEIERLRAL